MCDMVEKLVKVMNFMIDWVVNVYVCELIFNLKLLMKKCFDSVYECLKMIKEEFEKYGVSYEL